MASKFGLNRILEFIGLVDDVSEDDGYASVRNGQYRAEGYRENAYDARAPRGGARNPARGAATNPASRGAASARKSYAAPRAAAYETRQTPSARSAEPRADNARAIAPRRAEGGIATGKASTVIYYLHSLEECCDVISDLIDNKTVLLNLEEMDASLMQRAVDTLSGAAFALNATLRKASEKTYLIAPVSVEVNYTRNVERKY